jgi:RNA polymerase sigma factor (sigma-70 family)
MENGRMQAEQQHQVQLQLEELIPVEWGRVVRLCARLSGSPDAAEDLAQETMIEAWRHGDRLRNAEALVPWLSGIARNVCLRWMRRQGRDAAKLERFARSEWAQLQSERGTGLHDELDMEPDELAILIDRALGNIPSSAREVLLQHYIEERPHAEIAGRLGVSEGAVAVRIHRGKQALKQALGRHDLGGSAAYGLIDPGDVGWQQSRVWCPLCGDNRLLVRIDREAGIITSQCSGPCVGDGTILGGKLMTVGTSTMTSVKSILRRELIDLHGHYQRILATGGGTCHVCRRPVALERWPVDAPASPYAYGVLMICAGCGSEDSAPLSHLLLDTPLVQQFWRRYPRMRVLPVRTVDTDGRVALVCGFESVDSTATIEVVSAADTQEILHVAGAVDR